MKFGLRPEKHDPLLCGIYPETDCEACYAQRSDEGKREAMRNEARRQARDAKQEPRQGTSTGVRH